MRNENVFMSRKRQYGEHPARKKRKILRPRHAQQTQRPSKMDRHDQSIAARDIGNAWWETVSAARWARGKV